MTTQNYPSTFSRFAARAAVAHTATYFVFGLIMSNLFHYERVFQQEIIKDFMRPMISPYVFAGPFLQPIRGLLFAIGLWPIRKLLVEGRCGWLMLWNLLVMFGILSTPAAAPCSMEGLLYTKLPLWYHLMGLPEILLQTLAFSLILIWWERRALVSPRASAQNAGSPATGIVKAVMIACFAYMGYAMGGMLSVVLTRTQIDMNKAASDVKTQMMFVTAFLVNAAVVFFIARRWQAGRMKLWMIFVIFLAVDTAVPWIYQAVFLSPSPAHLALLLGFFPAAIITLSIRTSHSRRGLPASECRPERSEDRVADSEG